MLLLNKFRVYVFLLVTLVLLTSAYYELQNLSRPWERALDYSLQVNDRQGKALRMFTTESGYWRTPASLEQIDKRMIQLLLSYEDQRYYQHLGVDFRALLRAAWQFLMQGQIVSGASTISMQTIRLLEPQARTLSAKLYEMLQAMRMEHALSKTQILQLYLTLASYGGNIQGINAAAQFYFDKLPQRLNLSEIALLIALPQSPERRRPDRYPLEAKNSRNKVLKRLLLQQKITSKEFQIAAQQVIAQQRKKTPMLAPHLAMRIKQNRLSGQTISVSTTLDHTLQLKTEQLLQQSKKRFANGETLALVIVDNQTREIMAYAGSADYNKGWKLDLTRAVRSPGSALKPFIYGMGFETNLFHPNTRVLDQPVRINAYTPQNFDGNYSGEVSITQALQYSLNIPAVLALSQVGPLNFLHRLEKSGVKLTLPQHQSAGLPIALGGVGINLYDLVSLYTALANQGEYRPLSYTLNEHSKDHSKDSSVKTKQLLSSTASYYIDAILKDSPAPKGFINQHQIRFKTGTSYGFRDTWAVGYNQYYTVGIWSGRPDGGYMQQQTGINRAAPVLFKLFDRLSHNKHKPGKKLYSQSHLKEHQIVSHAQLPRHLKWLGNHSIEEQKSPLILRYPVNGSTIAANNEKQLVVKAQGGKKPYQWLINGAMVKQNSYKNSWQWNAPDAGQYQFTLIDDLGAQQSSEVWIQ